MTSKTQVSSNAQIAFGEHILRNFGQFLMDHSMNLENLLKTDETMGTITPTATNGIDSITNDPGIPSIIDINFDQRHECISLFQLIASDNRPLNKIITVFAQLCQETRNLTNESEHFQMKFMKLDDDLMNTIKIDTENENDENPSKVHQNQQIITVMSEMLEFLCQIQYILNRSLLIAINIVKQLNALFCHSLQFINVQSSIHFQSVFGYFADLMFIYCTFSECLKRSSMAQYWSTFAKAIETICENSELICRHIDRNINDDDIDQSNINGMRCILGELRQLFSGDLMEHFIDTIRRIKMNFSSEALTEFSAHFLGYIRNQLIKVESFDPDLCDGSETREIVKANLVCVIGHCLFGAMDSSAWKTLFELNSIHCSITLIGTIIWLPDVFIERYAIQITNMTPVEQKFHQKWLNEMHRTRQMHLQSKCATLQRDVQAYTARVLVWNLRFREILQDNTNGVVRLDDLIERCSLLFEGIRLNGKMCFQMKSLTNLHIHLSQPMNRSTLNSISKFIECIHIINSSLRQHLNVISNIAQNISQHLSYQALSLIEAAKIKLNSTTSIYNARNIDIMSALQIAEKSMQGSITFQRILITRLALSIADPIQIFSVAHLDKLTRILSRLDRLIDIRSKMIYRHAHATASFMYWYPTMWPTYLKQIMDQGGDVPKLKYLIQSFNFIETIDQKQMKNSESIINGQLLFNAETQKNFREIIVSRLCANIETHLRLEAHANVSKSQLKMCKTTEPEVTNNIINSIWLKPMPVMSIKQHLLINEHIERYLSQMFYNLTTVTLHDWRTYGEMRCLANVKFGLKTVDDYLPQQTLEQGIDVLEIMRNIHVFVSKYLYNLNNQVFIEHSSNNKHLNTINIRHIANSFRTHGTGIINTTVNFTYQFLRKKFSIFSQFMYDELIKSRLLKDLKYFRENKDRLNQMYSYERAEQFCRGIRKLGLSPTTSLSYLDLFRQLISHIGNALGFVRLMRSGGIHCGASANVFLPNFNDDEDCLNVDKLPDVYVSSDVTYNAAKNLEIEIKNLSSNSIEKTDYFRLLLLAFAPFFRDPKNVHLRNFYLIVPPLTINFIEYILMAKERMAKKNRNETVLCFTDDGFAIGLVYILKLLDQMSDFNSLYWFKSVRLKYVREREQLIEQQKTIDLQMDEKLQQTFALTEKRISMFLEEFDLLYCNMSSAKNFF